MTTLREAAQRALGALEILLHTPTARKQARDAIAALRAALAEQDDDLTAAWMAGAAEERKRAEQKCPCGDRPADQCPGEWEPGCDLGANEKYAKVAEVVEDHFSKQVVGIGKWASLPNGTKLYTTPPAPQSLRDLCAAAYQVVGVADGPVEMLDNLVAAAEGEPLPHDPGAGLPWSPPSPQPLTDFEILDVYTKWDSTPGSSWADYARAVEAEVLKRIRVQR